jgi:hypothetical protein
MITPLVYDCRRGVGGLARVSSGFCSSPSPKLASHWLNLERSPGGSTAGGTTLESSVVLLGADGKVGSGFGCVGIR